MGHSVRCCGDPNKEEKLFEAAVANADEQAARADNGEGVGAAALADDGSILTGVWVDAMLDSACLCGETGPICEAHSTGRRLTASICVRSVEGSGHSVLAACGVYQERLTISEPTSWLELETRRRVGFDSRR